MLDDWRTHWLGRRLSTKKRVLTNLLNRNILGRRRDSTAITSITTPTCSVRRSRSSWLFVGHVESSKF